MDRNCNKYDKTNLRLKMEPRDDIQIKSLAFLTGEGKFKYTQEQSQLSLNLDKSKAFPR